MIHAATSFMKNAKRRESEIMAKRECALSLSLLFLNLLFCGLDNAAAFHGRWIEFHEVAIFSPMPVIKKPKSN
jgi:hypothetical protein